MYFVCEFGLLLVKVEKWPLRNEVTLGLDYWWISWPITAYENYNKPWQVSGCGLSKNMKKVGEGTNAVKILAISHDAMQSWCLKSRKGQDAPEQKAVARPRETNKNKKVTSKIEQGLNFTVNVDFWFCNDDFYRNPPKTWFLSFFYVVINGHFRYCPNSKGHILQKTLTFLRLLDIPIWRTCYSMLTTDS